MFAVCYVVLLIGIPESFRVFVIVWNVITIISMCAGRIVFSIRAEKKLNKQADFYTTSVMTTGLFSVSIQYIEKLAEQIQTAPGKEKT